jgi:Kef-type K+ transport system membrane component KefB
VPLFLLALMLVRGVPAVLYRGSLGTRRTIAAAFLQATSLPFIVATVAIGQRLHALTPATGAALVAAGLVSVLFFPAIALGLLRGAPGPDLAAAVAHTETGPPEAAPMSGPPSQA